jgi:hypothetical protein
MFRTSSRFVLSYVGYWILAAGVYMIASVVDGEHPPGSSGKGRPPRVLSLALAFAMGGRGVVTFVVWLLTYGRALTTPSQLGVVFKLPSLGSGSSSGSGGYAGLAAGEASAKEPLLAAALAEGDRQNAVAVAHGSSSGVTKGRSSSVGSVASASSAPRAVSPSPASAPAAAPPSASVGTAFLDEDPSTIDLRPHLNIALRREILHYATMGIAKAGARAKRNPDAFTDGQRIVKGSNVCFNTLLLSRGKEERGLFDLERLKKEELQRQQRQQERQEKMEEQMRFERSLQRRVLEQENLREAASSGAGALAAAGGSSINGDVAANSAAPASAVDGTGGSAEGLSSALKQKSRSSPSLGASLNSVPSSVGSSPLGGAVTVGIPLPSPRGNSSSPVFNKRDDPVDESKSLFITRIGVGKDAVGNLPVSLTMTPNDATPGGSKSKDDAETSEYDSYGRRRRRRNVLSRLFSILCNCECGEAPLPRYKFLDYEPHLFGSLRRLHGINDDDYVASLSRTRREKFGEGASGAFLYFSTDERFIVKTLTKSEAEVLLSMVHDYVSYMFSHPHSLITRFYGCHSLTMYQRTMYFIVMSNVLTTHGATLHERYDLKGSWVNRHRTPQEKGQRTDCRYCGQKFRVGDARDVIACPSRPNRPHEPNTVLKDNDLSHKLRLQPDTAQALGDQIASDADFLRRHGITDYSLLLGIHRTRYKLVEVPLDDGSHSHPVTQAAAMQPTATAATPLGPHAYAAAGNGPAAGLPSGYNFPAAPAPLAPSSGTGPSAPGAGDRPNSLGATFSGLRMSTPELASSQSRAAPWEMPSFSLNGGIDPSGSTSPVVSAGGGTGLVASSLGAGAAGIPVSLNTGMEDAQSHHSGTTGSVAATHDGSIVQKPSEPHNIYSRPFFRQHRGGLRATIVEGPGIYYLGIIDVLQQWSFMKKLERFFKTKILMQSGQGLSCMMPDLYAARFRSRVIGQLIEGYQLQGWEPEQDAVVASGGYAYSAPSSAPQTPVRSLNVGAFTVQKTPNGRP